MAYVRRRGNQIAIVQGQREQGTGRVEQKVLFTIYSKAEAHEALGRGDEGGAERFRALLEFEYPELRFDWAKLRAGIEENLAYLPEVYEYRAKRLKERFRLALRAFTRELLLTEPHQLSSTGELLRDQRLELQYLREVLDWKLALPARSEEDWSADGPFFWRFSLRGRELPPEAEEHATAYYERGDLEATDAIFGLLTECFENYADGYNTRGLVAYDRGRLADAVELFEKTIEVGRTLFPQRIARGRYWKDLATRPYIRGLRNLALTLNEMRRFDEALQVCDRLDTECADDLTAAYHRASIFLNLGRWKLAEDAAVLLHTIYQERSFVAAFARYEQGDLRGAVASFLHAALNHPRTARTLLGQRFGRPVGYEDTHDHNLAISLSRSLHSYLAAHNRRSRRFFKALLADPRVAALLAEIVEVREGWRAERTSGDRKAYDRMRLMTEPEFARIEAAQLSDVV